jgi:hypothetical protein
VLGDIVDGLSAHLSAVEGLVDRGGHESRVASIPILPKLAAGDRRAKPWPGRRRLRHRSDGRSAEGRDMQPLTPVSRTAAM